MDMHEASRILSMDILGLSLEDFDDRTDDDFTPCEWDDAYDDTQPAFGQEYTLHIHFDADSSLEALLIGSLIQTVLQRRSSAENVVITLND